MIQQAMDRCENLVTPQQMWVVTNTQQAEATTAQLSEIPSANILREPVARNTAPCIGLAAIHLLAQDPEAIMLLMPADHVISPVAEFEKSVQIASQLIEQDSEKLVLFGVVPSFPATGYGYIERGKRLSGGNGNPIFEVAGFREKPNHDTAEEFVARGTFFWNCGIFVWKARTILDLIAKHEPQIYEQLDQLRQFIGTPEYEDQLANLFPNCSSISIDYAILERTSNLAVVEALFSWDDVGSWQSLQRLRGKDDSGTTVVGTHLGIDTHDCIIYGQPNHLIATLGVDHLIIVNLDDATYVADKRDENAIKQLIELIRERGLEQFL